MRFALAILASWACAAPQLAATGPVRPEQGGLVDLPMYRDPVIEMPAEDRSFHPRLKALWLQAIARPEAMYRRQAAEAFMAAAKRGMALGSEEAATLSQALQSDPEPTVRAAAAEALLAGNITAAAPVALEVVRDSTKMDLTLALDRALVAWRHEPAVAVWIDRLSDATAAESTRISAAEALGKVGAASAWPGLREVAVDRDEAARLRLAAANAAGDLFRGGGVGAAEIAEAASALVEGTPADRLVATAMLAVRQSHPSAERDPRIELLRALMDANDPTIVAKVVPALAAIDPATVAGRLDSIAAHPDANVRRTAVEAPAPTPQAGVEVNVALLADPSVEVRHAARERLEALAGQPESGPLVRAALGEALRAEDWRGLEQAALLAGSLDHEAVADELIALIRHDRPEVRLAAAASLRQISVESTLPVILRRVEELTNAAEGNAGAGVGAIGDEATQLIMALGESEYEPADAILRRYIPKASSLGPSARGAAIYALGKLHEGTNSAELANAFSSRLSDLDPMAPEVPEVRRFAAVGLGRLGAAGKLNVLRRFVEEEGGTEVGAASRWAIERITGEPQPPLPPIEMREGGWFLEPIE